MGIDIGSKFVVGLYYEDFPDNVKEIIDTVYGGDIHEWNYSHYNLDYASPYYDASPKECFFGFELNDGIDVPTAILSLEIVKNDFIATGLGDPVVYAGKHVW